MTILVAALLGGIFLLLSAIHLYWLAGGQWGLRHVIPTESDDLALRPPPKLATLLVALVLFVFGWVYLSKAALLPSLTPTWFNHYLYWLIPIIFLLRAMGDFRYVGFFKRIKNTVFAKADTKWFSPLCLVLGVLGLLFQFL